MAASLTSLSSTFPLQAFAFSSLKAVRGVSESYDLKEGVMILDSKSCASSLVNSE